MIETQNIADQNTKHAAQPRKILHMVKNDRMAGKVPSWKHAGTPKQQIEQALNTAQTTSFKGALHNAPDNTLSYTGTSAPHTTAATNEEFKFADLIDMINPLHHIPVIGHIYREISEDEIKPIGQIIGGGIFGGPLGAAGGLVNTVIEAETGKDVAGNALSMVKDGSTPNFKNIPDHPESRLSHADEITRNIQRHKTTQPDLPASLLSFTNHNAHTNITIDRLNTTEDRTAKTSSHKDKPPPNAPPNHIRSPITQVRLSGLYALGKEK